MKTASDGPERLRETRRRLLGALRAGLCAVVIVLVSSALLTGTVVAEWSERTLRLGDDLGAWSSLIGPSTEVTVNGQELLLGSMTLAMSVEDVMARFAALCRQGTDEPISDLTAPAARAPAATVEEALLDIVLVRRESNGKEGAGACLAGAGRGGIAALAERMQELLRTGDLGALGALRYLRVREAERGSHVVVVWNRGTLRLHEMFPEHGDAPGEDFAARPPAAVRTFSAVTRGSEHGLNVYRSGQPSEHALEQYGRALTAGGFALAAGESNGPALAQLGRTYVKDGRVLLVRAQPEESGSLLSVVQLADGQARRGRALP